MTQEEKRLLVKDLCARLPYGVKFQGEDSNVYTLDASNYFTLQVKDVVFKPYLRPMESMTYDEWQEYLNLDPLTNGWWVMADWLNTRHFDYRGLIPMGLALEAKEGMYEIQEDEEETKIEIPKNLEEALSILNEVIPDEDKEYLKENGAISVHLSLGMWIRNNFGLWENSEFYEYLSNKVGLIHPDDMSNYVIEEFIKTL